MSANLVTTYNGSKQLETVQDRLRLDVEMFVTDTECCRIKGTREITVYQKNMGQLHGESRIGSGPRI